MDNLYNLSKTEKLTESAKIIEENLFKVLKQRNADKSALEKQMQINKDVEDFVVKTGNIDNLSDEEFVAKNLIISKRLLY